MRASAARSPASSPSGKSPDDVRHDTASPAPRTSATARSSPIASSLRMAMPMPGAPAAAMASTSRSNGQLSVVIWETDTRRTARR